MSSISEIKQFIEAERLRRNLSQRELCKLAGVSSATYGGFISKRTSGNIVTLLAFCDALGIEIELRVA
jgi:transcriptional regulator with XRE-family HTH domain